MTPERWARIKEIFGAALELSDPERAEFLKQNCGSDAGLREEIQRLLDEERGPLENPMFDALVRLARTDLERGEMLGPYRVEVALP